MTPLAHRVAAELTIAVSDRLLEDRCGLLRMPVGDFHCFETTAVNPLICDFERRGLLPSGPAFEFLPAPWTWLEWASAEFGRAAYLLRQADGSGGVKLYVITSAPFCARGPLTFSLQDSTGALERLPRQGLSGIYGNLGLINTPQIIGRVQHMPHAGLQRRLANARGLSGKFPLRAWTELKLEVGFSEFADGRCREARLTGERALHFCRAHLRFRNGKVEIVSAHWRGDASLGIKRQRYRVEPNRQISA